MESMKDFEQELTNSFRVIREGEFIRGMIVDINDDEVTLDLGYYAPGVIPMSELSDDPDFSAMKDLKIGEQIEAVVLEADDGRGNVKLSMKEANVASAWEKLRQMKEDETVATVKVKETVNAGVIAYLEGIRAFIPASQLALTYVEDTEEYIGKTLEVKVITADENAGKLVLSAKAVLKEKEAEHDREKMAMMDNGLTGLVHISKICMKRIKKPSEVLSVGQKVKVKVLEVKDGKISLSIRDVETNTSEVVTDVIEDFDYKCEEIPNNPFGSLLAGFTIDE